MEELKKASDEFQDEVDKLRYDYYHNILSLFVANPETMDEVWKNEDDLKHTVKDLFRVETLEELKEKVEEYM